jgi:hypothetical protein
MKLYRLIAVCMLLAALTSGQTKTPQPVPSAQAKPELVVMEYYYKVQWGHQSEFLKLFQKNHLPILRKLKDKGEVLAVKIEKPAEHGTEDGRWDYRVTITFRDLNAAFGDKSADYEMTKRMYPDWTTFEREEQRRFEILLAHWDLRIEDTTPE